MADAIALFAGYIVDYGGFLAAIHFVAAAVYLIRGITGWGYGNSERAAGKDPEETYFGRLGKKLGHNWGSDVRDVQKISIFEYSEFKKLVGEIDGFVDNAALNTAWRHQKRRDKRQVARAHARI